ncbi:MAG: hypothetical protein ACE5FF_00150 [Saprospiraceae bacterium]
MEKEKTNRPQRIKAWAKKAGVAGVIFFTAKGLLWLAFGGVLLEKCLPG